MKKLAIFLFSAMLILGNKGFAQMPNDAIMMPKNTFCSALGIGQTSWNKYWENELFRDNPNLGTFKMQSAMAILAYGFADDKNFIIGIPYVKTSTSQGNLKGLRGIQDGGLWYKQEFQILKNFKSYLVIGGTLPLSNYVSDFMPMSIGLRAKTMQFRTVLNYSLKNGFYTNGIIGYQLRGKSQLDRDAYLYNNTIIQSSKAEVPDVLELGLRIGYLSDKIQTEVYLDKFNCLAGDNMRRNDMPFVTNKTVNTQAGFYFKYQPVDWGVSTRIAQTLDGRNTAKATSFSLSVLYLFSLNN